MPADNSVVRDEDQEDTPSVRQLLHAATGDREAEAKALADRAGAHVDEDEAKVAVELAHGDIHGGPKPERDVASPEDVEAVKAEDEGDTD
jgi:predicted AAA+ superfamily ATPase